MAISQTSRRRAAVLFAAFFISTATAHASPVLLNNSNFGTLVQNRLFGSAVTVDIAPTIADGGAREAELDNVISDYNSVEGSQLVVTKGGDAGNCTENNIQSRIQEPGFRIIECPPAALEVIGLSPDVLGATVTEVNGGIILRFTVIVRTNIDPFFQHVLRHELGHGVGLDHTSRYSATNPDVMFPLALIPTVALNLDDISGVLTNYAEDPTVPNTMFAGSGACVSGKVQNQDDVALNGVIITAYDQATGNPVVTTVSGTGTNSEGFPNGIGEYTLCAPAAVMTHMVAQLCDIATPVGTIQCGINTDTLSVHQIMLVGGGLSILTAVNLPYEKTDRAFIYNATATQNFDGSDLTGGTALTLAPNDFTTDINFNVQADLAQLPPPINTGPAPQGGGCQASPHSGSGMDLSWIALLLAPLALQLTWRGRKVLSR